MQGKIFNPNTGDLLDILGFAGRAWIGHPLLPGKSVWLGRAKRGACDRRLRDQVHRCVRPAEHCCGGGCTLAGHRKEGVMTLSHFSAVLVFSFFTSIVFGITQRAEPKMMMRFGAFCFAVFVFGTDCGELGYVPDQALVVAPEPTLASRGWGTRLEAETARIVTMRAVLCRVRPRLLRLGRLLRRGLAPASAFRALHASLRGPPRASGPFRSARSRLREAR